MPSGPPPKSPEQRARRNATVAMTKLPASGRSGKPPKWPLYDDVRLTAKRDFVLEMAEQARAEAKDPDVKGASKAAKARAAKRLEQEAAELTAMLKAQRKLEAELWKGLWATPQAVQWEKLQWTRDIAQYVRHKVLGELGSLDDAKEARMLADRIGLTPWSLLRLRWLIEDAPAAATRSTRGSQRGGRSRYAGMHVVGGTDVAG